MLGDDKKYRNLIAYRDSVLIRLLEEELGGNSRTVMLYTLSPGVSCY